MPTPDDPPSEIPNGAELPRTAVGDLDGDGRDDQLTTWRLTLGDDEVIHHLRVVTSSGKVVEGELSEASAMADVRPLGTIPVGDGKWAALVVESAGASGENIALWGLHAWPDDPCSLGRLTIADDSAELTFPIGGTVGQVSGLRCTEVDGMPALGITTATQESGGDTYAWQEQRVQWSGAGALRGAGTDSGSVAVDGLDQYAGLDCPGISLE
ncbi:hypothetical protein [Nocardioides sp. AE5]|uniref:hypothetical protein n=1 Tax=Nocardioides sp. AE5 TaxID=2962573 RepID=UPI002882B288|nr:hypothetical protein [Nocardioides sp. AE5]MDT0202308.1 hypothetical protein [Nocardioides sp. AE5]